MGLSDLHIHTIYSHDGTVTVPAVLKKAAEIRLDVIAITDHDEFDGALEALDLAPAYGVSVIPACEISTLEGHLVALFIHSRIPKFLPFSETLRRVADQGGLCFAAHPGGQYNYSLSPDLICRTLEDPELARVLVGIEAFNAGLLHMADNAIATALARDLPVARLGNSDAHIVRMIGTGTTWFQGTSAQDLRRALEAHSTEEVVFRPRPRLLLLSEWGARLALRYARRVSGRGRLAGRTRAGSRELKAAAPPLRQGEEDRYAVGDD